MENLLENSDLENILDILENMNDEILAAELLSEFNDATSQHGKLILNMEEGFSHEDWKKECDQAVNRVKEIIEKIKSHR